MTITATEVRTLVKEAHARTEKTLELLDAFTTWADANAGKLLTERNKPEGWRIRKEYGMTHLEHDDYWRARFGHGPDTAPGAELYLLIAHAETHVVIPGRYSAPGSGRDREDTMRAEHLRAENERRAALLADSKQIARIVRALNSVSKALAEVADALPNGPGTPVPDRYRIIEAAGLDDVKVGRLQL